MAEIKSYPNNSDEYIGAEEVMRWHHGRTSGVYAGAGNAAVTAVQNSMRVSVAPGIGWLTDAGGNGICWWFPSAIELTVDAAESTGTLNRIDRVIVRWPTTDYADKPELLILKGTSASAAVAPALTNNSTVREISLARISIPAGTVSLTPVLITDERPNASVCGYVTETVTADTSMIYQEYVYALDTLRSAITQAWSGEISDKSITRAKLANDALYSPVKYITAPTYDISSADIGATISCGYAMRNTPITVNLTQAVSTTLPIGTEIAILNFFDSSITITVSGIQVGVSGIDGGGPTKLFYSSTSHSFKPGDIYSMLALKKISSDSTYGDCWLLTGNAEVVS